jgi:two-component system sensor histidine kinase BaeS
MSAAVSIDRSPTDASAVVTWAFAVSAATLGTAILWKASVGINVGVWTACVVVGLFAIIRERFGTVGAPTIAAGAWAAVLAFCTAITTDGFRTGILILAAMVLVAIALVTAGDQYVDALQPLTAFLAPLMAIGTVASGLAVEVSGGARTARSPGVTTLVRTMLITLPVVLVLVLLLAEADPLFAAARDALAHIVPEDFIPRAIFFTVLFGVTLGGYGAAQRGRLAIHEAPKAQGLMLGAAERRVLLTSLASIMWLFVVSATRSLLQNPAAVAGSGITYADYVHRGFAELTVAATLVIGITMVTRRSWIGSDGWARAAALAALTGEGGMIVIAFMRVIRYEQAYGYTDARLHAQAYMIVLACMSALLLREIARRSQSTRFAYHSATAALVVLVGCVLFNTDAWIVRENVNRYVTSGQLDLKYLETQLSDDAIPALVESAPRLHEPERGELMRFLRSTGAERSARHELEWYAWNYRAHKSAEALRAFRGNDAGIPGE